MPAGGLTCRQHEPSTSPIFALAEIAAAGMRVLLQ
jgi:hypothetical protein